MRPISFVYLREGRSDEGLLPHLRSLLVRAGASEAVGSINSAPGPVEAKLAAAVAAGVTTDLYFVHRDADTRSPQQRRDEITAAARSAGVEGSCVCVVPVQAIESWLLLDEPAIRAVVGRRNGRTPLDLPSPRSVQAVHDPKSVLARVLLDASEASGRRRERERRQFPQRRRALLERLEIDGPVAAVPSWQQLVTDVESAIAERS